MSEDELVTVFEGALIEVDILKSRLEAEGITCFLNDNYMGTLAPFYTSVGGVSPIKIIVPKTEKERAKPIIEDYLQKM